MGQKGTKIIELNVKELIQDMNKALADEWLAYYQYWIGAKVIQGRAMHFIREEMEEHAKEELKHADMLAERILTLGGTPLLTPEKWFKETICGYVAPKNFSSQALIKQNLSAERCAIAVYQKLVKKTDGKDHLTHQMFLSILKDEVEHEDDLENMLSAFKSG